VSNLDTALEMRAAKLHNAPSYRLAKAAHATHRHQSQLAAAAPGQKTERPQLDTALQARAARIAQLKLGDKIRAAAEKAKIAADKAKNAVKEAAEKVAAAAKEAAEKAKNVADSVKENGIKGTIQDIKDDGSINGSNKDFVQEPEVPLPRLYLSLLWLTNLVSPGVFQEPNSTFLFRRPSMST
jgi:hypothetical protein